MTTPDIQSLVESVKPVRDILGEPLVSSVPISPTAQFIIDQQAEVTRLRAELTEEKRKVEAGIAAIKDTPHSITCAAMKYLGGPINSHCDCWKSRALAALTAPGEKKP